MKLPNGRALAAVLVILLFVGGIWAGARWQRAHPETPYATRGITGVLSEDTRIDGKLQVGGADDYATFEADGTLALTGAATGWEDLRIDGLATRAGVVAPTDETGFRGSSAFQSRNMVHNQADEVQFAVQMPHAWQAGTAVYPHVHFSPWITNVGDAAVSFVFDCYDVSINGVFPATSTLYTVTKTWNGSQQWAHLLAGASDSYAMTGIGISGVQKCRLFRDNTVANNLAGKVALLYIDWHYQIDTPAGSREALSK